MTMKKYVNIYEIESNSMLINKKKTFHQIGEILLIIHNGCGKIFLSELINLKLNDIRNNLGKYSNYAVSLNEIKK